MANTRFTPELDLEGLSPDEAFAVLGNELRLEIIRTLWEADAAHTYDDVTDTATAIPFSELRRRVDVADSGRFNYDRGQLTPSFVWRTDGGYRLSGPGKQIARTGIVSVRPRVRPPPHGGSRP